MKDIRILPATIVGTLLYMGLSWVPLIGPLVVGFVTGWIRAGTTKEGFNAGIISGTVGFISLMILLSTIGIFENSGYKVVITLLVLWIIFLWNLMGVLLCGIGGFAGSLVRSTHMFFEKRAGTGVSQKKGAKTFLICSDCGVGNLNTEKICTSCGNQLHYGL